MVVNSFHSICLFVAAFAYMDLGELSPSLLFCMMTVLTIVGCALFGAVEGRKTQAKTSREGEILVERGIYKQVTFSKIRFMAH